MVGGDGRVALVRLLGGEQPGAQVDFGAHGAGQDTADADLPAPEFRRHDTCQPLYRGLGGGIRRRAGIGAPVVDRAQEDDGALRCLQHGHRHAGEHHAGDDVGIECLFQELLGVGADRLAVHVGGVVDQHVELAAVGQRGVQHRLAVRLLRHVADHGTACRPDRGRNRIDLVLAPAGDRDPCTARRKQPRNALPDAGAAPGDQYRHALDLTHHMVSRS